MKKASKDTQKPIGAIPVLWGLVFLTASVLWCWAPSRPVPSYWSDFAGEIIDARNVLDLGRHRLTFDPGRREPFFTYACALVWLLIPSAKALLVQRLVSALLAFSTLWLLYLAGKETAGKKAGIFAAAFGAVSLALASQVMTGIRIVALPPAVLLLYLWSLRAVRKPDSIRIFRWALALALGAYTYTAFWAFWLAAPLALVGGLRDVQRPTRAWKKTAWAFCGALLLVFPLFWEGRVFLHAQRVSVFAAPDPDLFRTLLSRVGTCFHLLFLGGPDRWDLTPRGSALLGPWVGAIALFGAWVSLKGEKAAARALGLFLIFSLCPYLLAAEPHSGKLGGTVACLLILAGVGATRLWDRFGAGRSLGARTLARLVVAAVFTILFLSTLVQVRVQWPRERTATLQAMPVFEEAKKWGRVVLMPDGSWYDSKTVSVLLEGRDAWIWSEGTLLNRQSVLLGNDLKKLETAAIPQGFVPSLQSRDGWWEMRATGRTKDRPRERPGLYHRVGFPLVFGLGRGLRQGEDYVSNPEKPLSQGFPRVGGLRLSVPVFVKVPGWYEARPPDERFHAVWVDGQRVTGPVRLSMGLHDWSGFALYDGLERPPAGGILRFLKP